MFSERTRGLPAVLAVAALACVLCGVPASAEVVVYSEGFEATEAGYTHSGTQDQWEWGTPTFGAPGAHAGVKCWGTNLDGNVPLNSDSYLTSPAIPIPVLAPGQVARVRFFAWIAVDEMYDRGEFQVSSNGVNWETKAELFHTMQGVWTEYFFDVSSYSGMNLYLRFRCRADGSNAFSQSPYNMAGLYVDDVAVMIADAPITKTLVSLEAFEDQAAYASCPWVFTWNGQEFVKDNDVYSTARGAQKEFTDFYMLRKPLVPCDGRYLLALKETEDESSWTDFVRLVAIDHPAGVRVGTDDLGAVWTYTSAAAPASAVTDGGADVLGLIASDDDLGWKAFHTNTLTLDFGNLDTSLGATLVIGMLGFQADDDQGAATGIRPRVEVQTLDAGQWVTRGIMHPRADWSEGVYNLAPYLTTSKLVRLMVTSCHLAKYHLIDYVGMSTAPQAPITLQTLAASAADHAVNGSVLAQLSASDNVYATMAACEQLSLEFPVPPAQGEQRSFMFVCEGYYVPMGTFFIYTWDGAQWAQRDGWSTDGPADQTKSFDLSLWLPDPAGEYKVRIWQDYWYEPARVDFVGITRGAVQGEMVSAFDLRRNLDVTNLLRFSDNQYDSWGTGDSGYPNSRNRNRWIEVKWTGLQINTPPSVPPVTVPNPSSAAPTFQWSYSDPEGDPQCAFELEVWTGPGGTGDCVFDPPVQSGTAQSMVYAGDPLVAGQTYYVRVKAFDCTSWGGWSETSWTRPLGPPPTDFVVLQAYPGDSNRTLLEQAGNSTNVADPIKAVPGVLQIVPGHVDKNGDGVIDPKTERWSNFIFDANYSIKSTVLTKTEGQPAQCAMPGYYDGGYIAQRGTENIRTWWPLMYEAPGTKWELTIFYTVPGQLMVKKQTWTWTMDATLESMKNALALFHQLPFGLCQVPLVQDEVLYADLQSRLDEVAIAIAEEDWVGANDLMMDFEFQVVSACANPTSCPGQAPTGAGLGIVNTLQNPACCKLLIDAEYVAAKLGVWNTVK